MGKEDPDEMPDFKPDPIMFEVEKPWHGVLLDQLSMMSKQIRWLAQEVKDLKRSEHRKERGWASAAQILATIAALAISLYAATRK